MPSMLQQQPQDARDVRGTLMDLLNLLESRIRQQPQDALRFSVSEVEALFELFKSISGTVIDDGLINKVSIEMSPKFVNAVLMWLISTSLYLRLYWVPFTFYHG